jgi:hypothetical protein
MVKKGGIPYSREYALQLAVLLAQGSEIKRI